MTDLDDILPGLLEIRERVSTRLVSTSTSTSAWSAG